MPSISSFITNTKPLLFATETPYKNKEIYDKHGKDTNNETPLTIVNKPFPKNLNQLDSKFILALPLRYTDRVIPEQDPYYHPTTKGQSSPMISSIQDSDTQRCYRWYTAFRTMLMPKRINITDVTKLASTFLISCKNIKKLMNEWLVYGYIVWNIKKIY